MTVTTVAVHRVTGVAADRYRFQRAGAAEINLALVKYLVWCGACDGKERRGSSARRRETFYLNVAVASAHRGYDCD